MARRTRKHSYLVTSGRVVLRLTEAEEGGFLVTSPIDPELVTQADSIAEACQNVADAARTLKQARVKLLARLRARARAG